MQRRERHIKTSAWRENANASFDVRNGNFFGGGSEGQTAHGLLNIEYSVAAQIAVNLHLNLFDLREGHRGCAEY